LTYSRGVSLQNAVQEFLTSRRARLTPDRAGLPTYGERRRVTGLRREEVALLSGMSVDYYNRLERGNLRGVSESVLDALAQALQLDEAEQAHLQALARAANTRRQSESVGTVRPSVQRLLDTMTETAAAVFNPWMDILATNHLGRVLFAGAFDGLPNLARYAFLDPRAREFYPDWGPAADDAVAVLRAATGTIPDSPELASLIAELSLGSSEFVTRWKKHDVRFHLTGTKTLHHPVVGELTLSFEAMSLLQDPGLTILAYSAAAGSASEDALRMLASQEATQVHGGVWAGRAAGQLSR
jgi:transcriptional regulator with XRE-family HTH domain